MPYYGTVKPKADFDSDTEADRLYKAMKGMGCNKDEVVRVLTHLNNPQRQMLRTPFKTKYGKDLIETLQSELKGDLEDLVIALCETPTKYDTMELHNAVKGLGTKEKTIIEILTTRTRNELEAIKNQYKTSFGHTLEQDIASDTSGDLKRLFVSLVANGRDDSHHVDTTKANLDARKLINAGEKKLGTDEAAFNAILVAQSPAQLDRVFLEYEKISGHSIQKAIESEFGGDVKEGYLAIADALQSRPRYFAKQLFNSMKGMGTRDKDLIRVIVSRSEIDLALIVHEYEVLFKKRLIDSIKEDTSGPYRDGLIAIVKGN